MPPKKGKKRKASPDQKPEEKPKKKAAGAGASKGGRAKRYRMRDVEAGAAEAKSAPEDTGGDDDVLAAGKGDMRSFGRHSWPKKGPGGGPAQPDPHTHLDDEL